MLGVLACSFGLLLSSPMRRPTQCTPRDDVSMIILGDFGEGLTGDMSGPKRMTVGDDYVDPLFTERPRYDLCAASKRPDEVCCGAIAPETSFDIDEWAAYMRGEGKLQPFVRTLALINEDEACLRSPDGSAAGYDEALRAAGFTTVERIDLATEGARVAVLKVLQAAKEARERVCIHCADGTSMTSIVMADWLLTDYIGGDNVEEATEALRAQERLGGIGRVVDPTLVADFMVAGRTGITAAEIEAAEEAAKEQKVSPGGILLI